MYLRQKEDNFLIKCNKKAQESSVHSSLNYHKLPEVEETPIGPSGRKMEKPLKT